RDPGELREVLRERRRVPGRGDDVEVANRLRTAAPRGCLRDLPRCLVLLEYFDDGLDRGERRGEQRPLLLRLFVERLQDPLLRLRPQTWQRAESLRLCGLAEVLDGRDAELLPDPPSCLRPERGEPQEFRDTGWGPLLSFFQCLDLALVDDLDDLALDRLADPGQIFGLAFQRELCDRAARGANLVRGTAVGEHAKLLLAVQLEQIGQQIELLGHLRVARQGHSHRVDDKRVICVCLPTYNERENLEAMVAALENVLAADDTVLVIDDNSPDGTGQIADRLAAERRGVQVLHRMRKEGLGPAYLDGFRRALDLGADLIFEMDCDFSHDPADVPRLAAA